MTTTKTTTDIEIACESFLEDWDRQRWMQENGEWASAQWDDARETYEDAREALADLLTEAAGSLPGAERADKDAAEGVDLDAIAEALEAVQVAAKALDGQVTPNESDYIATGKIDPDDVSGDAEELGAEEWHEEWDCKEGWTAYRHGDALYLHWWRDARGQRHERSLWVQVDAEYFGAEEA